MNWRDEHPDRYGPVEEGDMICISGIDERVHFIKVVRDPVIPADATACGVEMPDWREDPTRFPMGGIVDCEDCLKAMRDAG